MITPIVKILYLVHQLVHLAPCIERMQANPDPFQSRRNGGRQDGPHKKVVLLQVLRKLRGLEIVSHHHTLYRRPALKEADACHAF
jgi:hypothetical protein